jgi:hypothetical protein
MPEYQVTALITLRETISVEAEDEFDAAEEARFELDSRYSDAEEVSVVEVEREPAHVA